MRRIVINKCYGGFGLSNQAILALYRRKHPEVKEYFFYEEDYDDGSYRCRRSSLENADMILTKDLGDEFTYKAFYKDLDDINISPLFADRVERHDPDLIAVVEQLGEKANGSFAELRIKEIPDDEKYIINEYDGLETIVLRSDVDKWHWK